MDSDSRSNPSFTKNTNNNTKNNNDINMSTNEVTVKKKPASSYSLRSNRNSFTSSFRDTQSAQNYYNASKRKNSRYPTISASSPYANLTPMDLGYKNIHPETMRARDIPFPELLTQNELRQQRLFEQLKLKEKELYYLESCQRIVKVSELGDFSDILKKYKNEKIKQKKKKNKTKRLVSGDSKDTDNTIKNDKSIVSSSNTSQSSQKTTNNNNVTDLNNHAAVKSISSNKSKQLKKLAPDLDLDELIGEPPMAIESAPKINIEVVEVKEPLQAFELDTTSKYKSGNFFSSWIKPSNNKSNKVNKNSEYSDDPIPRNAVSINTAYTREIVDLQTPIATPQNPEFLVETDTDGILSRVVYDNLQYKIKVHLKYLRDFNKEQELIYDNKEKNYDKEINAIDVKIKNVKKEIEQYNLEITEELTKNEAKQLDEINNFNQESDERKNQILKKNNEITSILQSVPPTGAISLDTKDAITKQHDCTPFLKEWQTEQLKLNEQIDTKITVISQLNQKLKDITNEINIISSKIANLPTTTTLPSSDVTSSMKQVPSSIMTDTTAHNEQEPQKEITNPFLNPELGSISSAATPPRQPVDEPQNSVSEVPPRVPTPVPAVDLKLEKQLKDEISNKLKTRIALKEERLQLKTLVLRLNDHSKNYTGKLSSILDPTVSDTSSVSSTIVSFTPSEVTTHSVMQATTARPITFRKNQNSSSVTKLLDLGNTPNGIPPVPAVRPSRKEGTPISDYASASDGDDI